MCEGWNAAVGCWLLLGAQVVDFYFSVRVQGCTYQDCC